MALRKAFSIANPFPGRPNQKWEGAVPPNPFMERCRNCGGRNQRSYLNIFRRFLYSKASLCPDCGLRRVRYHRPIAILQRQWRFMFSLHTQCPNCGSQSVFRSTYSEWASTVQSPLGWVQALVFAPVRECHHCRQQYYDWRSPRRVARVVAQTRSPGLSDELAALNRGLSRVSSPRDAPKGLHSTAEASRDNRTTSESRSQATSPYSK